MFAHASVHMDVEAAARCIHETRLRAPSATTEYKSDILRRQKHRRALMWLLGPEGPLRGNARVHLTDKTFLLVSRIADLSGATDDRHTIDAEGHRTFGSERWTAFLEASNDLMRARNGRDPLISVDAYFTLVDGMRRESDLMERLWQARPHVVAALEDPGPISALDPLIPAIIRAAASWGAVSVVHDRQTTLNERRVAHLKKMTGLQSLTLIDSRLDARVQVADLLAGAARRIASDELNGRGDEELTALLRPFVDPLSVWIKPDW